MNKKDKKKLETLFKSSYCRYERRDNKNEFILIVVLFILIIIVGVLALWWRIITNLKPIKLMPWCINLLWIY